MIRIRINDDEREVHAADLEGLLSELSLPAPLMLVEYNGQALHRSGWSEVVLYDGDRIELMKVAAGG